VEAVAAQQRQQQAVADFEAGRVTAAQAAASAEGPTTGAGSQDPHGAAAAHAADASVPMAIASSCRRGLPRVAILPHVHRESGFGAACAGACLASQPWLGMWAVTCSAPASVRCNTATATEKPETGHAASGRHACESLMCLGAARRLKHQITTLRQASLGIRARPVPDGTGDEDTAPAAESPPMQQPVLLFSNDGSVSIAQARDSL